jgi:hypothetical protein
MLNDCDFAVDCANNDADGNKIGRKGLNRKDIGQSTGIGAGFDIFHDTHRASSAMARNDVPVFHHFCDFSIYALRAVRARPPDWR